MHDRTASAADAVPLFAACTYSYVRVGGMIVIPVYTYADRVIQLATVHASHACSYSYTYVCSFLLHRASIRERERKGVENLVINLI